MGIETEYAKLYWKIREAILEICELNQTDSVFNVDIITYLDSNARIINGYFRVFDLDGIGSMKKHHTGYIFTKNEKFVPMK